jgi:glucose/mannose transport system permease protein
MRPRRTPSRLLIYAFLVFVALLFLVPTYLVVMTSFRSLKEIGSGHLMGLPDSWSLASWAKAWGAACTGVSCGGLRPYFLNSVLITVPAVLITASMGALNGYILAQWRFRGADLLLTLMLVGFFVPYQATVLPAAQLLGLLSLANSVPGLILVHVAYGIAFSTLLFRNFYVNIPSELVKAARVDGAGMMTIFRRIFLPLSLPAFMVAIIWQFTGVWNDFLFGVVFSGPTSRPVTVALNNLVNASEGVKEYNVDMAAALITALPTLIVYIVGGRYLVRGLTAGAVKG